MSEYRMVAVKRRWVPNWLFTIFAWPIDLIVHQPFRWIFTTPTTLQSGEKKEGEKSQPPKGYLQWHDWAADQNYHGLHQTVCPCCSRWLFPQEFGPDEKCLEYSKNTAHPKSPQ
jgi:hypothetical protein